MANVNKITLIGRLVRDPEMQYTAAGHAICKFNLAVSSGYGDKKTTDYFSCVTWRKTAEFVGEHCAKGTLVYLDGPMNSREYTNKDGHKVRVWDVTAETVQILSKPDGNGAAEYSSPQVEQPKTAHAAASDDDDPFAE